uniref:Fibronectin type-III domain-containing protein n=1 Tax=Gouania willdenowi TaxID=441366 RepID=A0A8C5EQG5_GOUWI
MDSGALFYVAVAMDGTGSIHSCNSMIESCKIVGLKCSTHYNIYVIASNFMCNSTKSETVTTETATCPPDTLRASLDCASNEALISWNGVPQMNSFTATIVDQDDSLLSCSSTNTSCKIPDLKCGQRYMVTLSAHDSICTSMPSEPIYIESVPCGPANIQTDVGCESGGLSISWDQASNAEGYTVVISNTSTHMTFNSTEPVLSIDTLGCGKEYAVSVTSFINTCTSFAAETTIREAPCVPTNLITTRTCSQSFVDVMWQESRGAKNYTAAAVDVDGGRLECVSNQTNCRLEGIMCGQVYNISVAAVDGTCTSTGSPSVRLETEPCPPSQLMVSLLCASNSASLTWDSSIGAASYTGKAVSSDAHMVTCEAGLSLGCVLEGLHCGKEYGFTVSTSNGHCQNVESEPVKLTTAPCVVQSMMTSLDCSTNVLTTSWESGAVPVNHSVAAVAADGTATLRCVTENSSCALTGLQCGQQYSVVVKAISSTCEGPDSAPEVVNSVPCVPANVQTTVDCSTNTLQASWDAADGAVSYISTLRGTGDFSSSCPTTDQSCPFAALQCAQEYVFSVTSVNDRCSNSWSSDVMTTTAPCDPTNVAASLDCASGVATVTWTPSAGADAYSAIAETLGHVDSCVSTGVSCELSQLQCGEEYTVTVLAGDAKCNSSVLATTFITTAPCPPTIQDHSVDYALNSALITWAEDDDAQLVTVTASSALGHSQSCNSSSSRSCLLDELQCGNTYDVEAVTHGAQCVSSPSSAFQIITAPCTPPNVDYLYSCETGITLVNWGETLGRESFYLHAEAGDHVTSCSSYKTNCTLSSLLCSRTYDVQVTAVAQHSNSSIPGRVQIQTAPCAPTSVGATLLCDDNTAEVTWEPSVGAMMYNVTATGKDRSVKRCGTNTTSCQLANMNCAEMYNITVTPFTTTCQGEETPPYSYMAGPCPPSNVQVSLKCEDNVGVVTWDAATQADTYEATAVSLDTHVYNCSTSGTGCSLTNLTCGESIDVTVVTVERGCRSEPSQLVTFQSVICPPTGLIGLTTCSNNDITVSWDPSPDSGIQYLIHSQEAGGVVASYFSTQTSHVLSGLLCGEKHSVRVAASDSVCTSVFSETITTDTGW